MGREENESSTRDAKRRNAHLELAPRAQKLAIHGGSVRHLYRALCGGGFSQVPGFSGGNGFLTFLIKRFYCLLELALPLTTFHPGPEPRIHLRRRARPSASIFSKPKLSAHGRRRLPRSNSPLGQRTCRVREGSHS